MGDNVGEMGKQYCFNCFQRDLSREASESNLDLDTGIPIASPRTLPKPAEVVAILGDGPAKKIVAPCRGGPNSTTCFLCERMANGEQVPQWKRVTLTLGRPRRARRFAKSATMVRTTERGEVGLTGLRPRLCFPEDSMPRL